MRPTLVRLPRRTCRDCLEFFRRGDATKDLIAMGEAAEPFYDFSVGAGLFIAVSPERRVQAHRLSLVVRVLAVLQRHVEKHALRWRKSDVETSRDGPVCELPRECITRKGVRRAARKMTRKLVEH